MTASVFALYCLVYSIILQRTSNTLQMLGGQISPGVSKEEGKHQSSASVQKSTELWVSSSRCVEAGRGGNGWPFCSQPNGGLLACLLFQKKSSRSPDQTACFFRAKSQTANVKLGLTQRPIYFRSPAAAISPAVVLPEREVFLGTRCLHVNYQNALYSRKKSPYQHLCSDGWRKDGDFLLSQFPDFFILLLQTGIAT